MSMQSVNQTIVIHSEHFAMLDQSEKNDRYLIENRFTVDVVIIAENYKKFHDKIDKSSLTSEKLKKLIPENHHAWFECWDPQKTSKLPSHRSVDHSIDLKLDVTLFVKKIYDMSRDQAAIVKKYVDDMLERDFIRRSHFNYIVSVLIIKKPDEELRIYVDYRALNALIIKNRNALSLIRDTLARLCHAKIYTKFDVIAVFNEVRIREDDQNKTAFITRYELFEYIVMSFELCNALGTFQSFINETLREYLNDFCTAYLNDILINSDDYKQHQNYVHKVLTVTRVT